MAQKGRSAFTLIEADTSRGIVRDAPRTAIPQGSVYDASDFLLHQPGLVQKRGGTSYAGPALTGGTYAAAVAYAEFPAGSKLCAIDERGHLFTVTSGATTDISTLGATFLPLDRPKVRIGGGKNLLIIPSNDGATGPKYYDGAAVGNLAATAPAGKFVEVYKTRVVLGNVSANPNRLYFSPTPDPTTAWDTTNSWIDFDYPITGLAATHNMLLVFSQGHTERLIGSTPPPGSDMDRSPIGTVGCTDARSIVVQENNVMFANTRGVFLTNGAGFASLTDEGLIASYWQSLFSGYDPTTWTIAAGIYRTFYIVSIIDNNGTLAATLMCNVPRRAWWRLTNIKARMFSQAVGAAEELYYADRATNRVGTLSGILSPASANKNDADGTAVTPTLTYRMQGQGTGVKAFGHGQLTYDMRDASADNPTLAVTVAPGVEATTFAAVAESPLAETSDAIRSRFTVNKDSQGITVKLAQTNASSKTEVYALEVESRPYWQAAGGQ